MSELVIIIGSDSVQLIGLSGENENVADLAHKV